MRQIIHGEKQEILDERTQELLSEFPDPGRDPDLNRSNEGITVVVL